MIPSPLRVGGIDYLNSRPLLEGLQDLLAAEPSGMGGRLENHVPSELARLLRLGELDAALVPVVEYFLGPPDYRIVPGIAIASYGAVESIRFYHRGAPGSVRRVGLDRSSMTSSILLRLLLRELWAPDISKSGSEPEFESLEPSLALAALASAEPGRDGFLLIGDAALAGHLAEGWRVTDLGAEWTRWTGLPFVYALWVARASALDLPRAAALARALGAARRLGEARIDAIVERGPLPVGLPVHEARRYLNRVIHYDLGPAEIEGLLLFQRRARECGLLPSPGTEGGNRELRFLEIEAAAKGREGTSAPGGARAAPGGAMAAPAGTMAAPAGGAPRKRSEA